MKINSVICADVFDFLRSLPDAVVQTCITSPPYWGLRDYGVDGQLGLEATPELFVAKMVEVFAEVRRVLRDDGTLWLNLGDSYAGSWGAMSHDLNGKAKRTGTNQRPPQSFIKSKRLPRKSFRRDKADIIPNPGRWGGGNLPATNGLKPKDLVGIPWRVAFALQADGWYLRSDIIWHKPNPMPESVTDRPTKSHEYLFLLSKSERYFYDADAIREPHQQASIDRAKYDFSGMKQSRDHPSGHGNTGNKEQANHPNGRNKRTVWTIATEPCPHAHFATFPTKLVDPCILAGSSERGQCPECGKPWRRETETTRTFESGSGKSGNMPVGKNGPDLQGGGETGDIRRGPTVHVKTLGWRADCDCARDPVPQIVLDPFCGKGTTAKRAKELGRRWLTCDLNPEYCKLAEQELCQEELFLDATR